MPSFQFRLPIRENLTRLQRNAIADDNAIFVTGVPGSGKTVVAIYRLARLDSNNSRLFTYTRMLTVAIKNSGNNMQQQAAEKVSSIYEWFGRNCHVMLSNIIDDENAIKTILNDNGISFDELIFDEAQDLPVAIYKALKSKSNKISIGADDAQMVFEEGCSEEDLNRIFNNISQHELEQNFRNTYEIFNFARHIITENNRAQNQAMLERLSRERRGDKPLIIFYNELNNITASLRQIINDNIGGNIGILLIHRGDVNWYYNLIRNELNIKECSHYYNGMDIGERNRVESDLKNILVTTFKSAKGMEFDTVIIPELHNITEDFKKQFFVGTTRARSNLFMFCQNDLPNLLNHDRFNNTYLTQRANGTPVAPRYTTDDDLPF